MDFIDIKLFFSAKMTYEIMMIRQSSRLLNNHVVSELSSSAIFNII